MKKFLKFIALPVMLLACLVMFGGCQSGASKFEVDMQKIYVGTDAEFGNYVFVQFLAGDYLHVRTADNKNATNGYIFSEYIPYEICNKTGEIRIVASYSVDGEYSLGFTIKDFSKQSIKLTLSQYHYFTVELTLNAEIDAMNV